MQLLSHSLALVVAPATSKGVLKLKTRHFTNTLMFQKACVGGTLTVTQALFDDMLGFVVEVRGAHPPWLTFDEAVIALRQSGLLRNPKTFPWGEVKVADTAAVFRFPGTPRCRRGCSRGVELEKMVPGWPVRQVPSDFVLGSPDHLIYNRDSRSLVVRLCGSHHLSSALPSSSSSSFEPSSPESLLRTHANMAMKWFCDGSSVMAESESSHVCSIGGH